MFGISARVEWQQPKSTNKRTMTRMLKAAGKKALEFWHRKFLRFHFTTYAYTRYRGVFKKRKAQGAWYARVSGGLYTRQAADPRPLYESGLTRIMAMSFMKTSGVSIGGGTKMGAALAAAGMLAWQTPGIGAAGITPRDVIVKGELRVPAYLGYLYGKGFDVNKELTVVNKGEMRQMARVAIKHIGLELKRPDVRTPLGISGFAQAMFAA